MSDVKKLYAKAYESYKEGVECCDNKYEWAASEVFGLATYDGALDKLFVERICDVCKYIAAGKTYEFIDMSDENYTTYILVCQLLYKKNWIEWGSSIRGAFFYCSCSPNPIVNYVCFGPGDKDMSIKVPFSTENIIALVEFLEEKEEISDE